MLYFLLLISCFCTHKYVIKHSNWSHRGIFIFPRYQTAPLAFSLTLCVHQPRHQQTMTSGDHFPPGPNHKWNWFQISRWHFTISLNHRFRLRFVVFCYVKEEPDHSIFFPKCLDLDYCSFIYLYKENNWALSASLATDTNSQNVTAMREHIPTNRKIFTGADIFRVSACVFLKSPVATEHWLSNSGANLRIIQNICVKIPQPVPHYIMFVIYKYVTALKSIMFWKVAHNVTQIRKCNRKTKQTNKEKKSLYSEACEQNTASKLKPKT